MQIRPRGNMQDSTCAAMAIGIVERVRSEDEERQKWGLKAWTIAQLRYVTHQYRESMLAETIRRAETAHRRGTAKGKLSKGLVNSLLKLQDNKCFTCGISLDEGYHKDHWIPLYSGGSNTDRNIRLLCPRCNLRKSWKHPRDFMKERKPSR